MRGLLGSVAIVLVTVAGCATPRSPVERGVALYHQGRWAAAAAAFEEAIEASPGDPDLYARRGSARLAAGDTPGAVADFNRALSLDPHHAGARAGLQGARPRGRAPGQVRPGEAGVTVVPGPASDPAALDPVVVRRGRPIALEGTVRSVDGTILTLAVAPGRERRVDLSALPLDVAATLRPGRAVSLVARPRPDGTRAARSLRLTYGAPEAP